MFPAEQHSEWKRVADFDDSTASLDPPVRTTPMFLACSLPTVPPRDSGVTMNGIARGNVGAWSALGSGVAGSVRVLARAANGDVIAGGDFAAAGGQSAANIARWNGSVWAPLGSGTTSSGRRTARAWTHPCSR